MTERRRLPNRRPSITLNFQCGPHHYTATISYFPGTNRLAEIFLGNGRAAAAKDSAVVASLALQFGVPLETIRRALLRDPRDVASSPLGVALDLIAHTQESSK
jgi:ribonucleoside-diphosphate reductase alpha chain